MEIKIKGIGVNYIDEGKGTPVLFLQGWGTTIELYKKLTDKIKEKNRVIALDLPGFGKTKEPPEAWNSDEYAEFIIGFVNELKLNNIVLMGHSNGGRLAIKLMNNENRNFEVDKVVLLDSAGIKAKVTFKKKVRQKWFKFLKKLAGTKMGRKVSPMAVYKLQNKLGSTDYRKASPLMKQVMVKAINEDLTDLLPKIDRPTLLIWGDMDTATPLSDGQLMEKLIPDAGLVILKNTGHYSFLEDFYTFSRVIDSFLNA